MRVFGLGLFMQHAKLFHRTSVSDRSFRKNIADPVLQNPFVLPKATRGLHEVRIDLAITKSDP